MKNSKIRFFVISAIGVPLFICLWLGTYGINKTVDRVIDVDVYENDGRSNITSSIKISGNLKKTLFSASFVGTFAIGYYEPSCRDGVEAKIDWQGNGCQNISFYCAGDFSRLDIQMIDIDEDMNCVMVVLKDGTIITNDYIPAEIWKKYRESFHNSRFIGPPQMPPGSPQPALRRGAERRQSETGAPAPVSRSRRRK